SRLFLEIGHHSRLARRPINQTFSANPADADSEPFFVPFDYNNRYAARPRICVYPATDELVSVHCSDRSIRERRFQITDLFELKGLCHDEPSIKGAELRLKMLNKSE